MADVSVLAFSVEKTLFETDVGAGAAGFGGGTFAGGEVGLETPIFNEIVGGGGGASVCSGRSNGGG